MKHSSWLLLATLGLTAPLLSAETLSLCVKANGAARFAKQCNPQKEAQQFVSTNSQPNSNPNPDTSGLRAITRKHVFPQGYLEYRDGWVSGPLCGEDEVLVSGGAELPILPDGMAIYCDSARARPEHGTPVSAQYSVHN